MTPAQPHRGRTRTPAVQWIVLLVFLASAVGVQAGLDGTFRSFQPDRRILWVPSPAVMGRLVLGFDALAADAYWIRAVQHYGGTRLSTSGSKSYDLLFPLLDITTSLDPRFNIAYRFGAILLSERYPNGPGRPDLAIALLEKGIASAPERWEYYHDAGFVEYWWRQDPRKAAEWMARGSKVPGAPPWLAQVAAAFLAEGGARDAAREMWVRLLDSEQEWMRRTAQRGLLQLDAEAAIEQLQQIVDGFRRDTGSWPRGWEDLIRAGRLRGIPADPSGEPFVIDPASGTVDVSGSSDLAPLPTRRKAAARP